MEKAYSEAVLLRRVMRLFGNAPPGREFRAGAPIPEPGRTERVSGPGGEPEYGNSAASADAMRKLTHDDAVSSARAHWRGWRAAVLSSALVLPLCSYATAAGAASGADAGLTRASRNPTSPETPPEGIHDLRASDIMSSDVSDSSGDFVGKAEDLLVDPNSGRITAAVVDAKDFFGVSTKKVIIPIQDLKIAGPRRLITTLDKKELLGEAPASE